MGLLILLAIFALEDLRSYASYYRRPDQWSLHPQYMTFNSLRSHDRPYNNPYSQYQMPRAIQPRFIQNSNFYLHPNYPLPIETPPNPQPNLHDNFQSLSLQETQSNKQPNHTEHSQSPSLPDILKSYKCSSPVTVLCVILSALQTPILDLSKANETVESGHKHGGSCGCMKGHKKNESEHHPQKPSEDEGNSKNKSQKPTEKPSEDEDKSKNQQNNPAEKPSEDEGNSKTITPKPSEVRSENEINSNNLPPKPTGEASPDEDRSEYEQQKPTRRLSTNH